jgi:flagellar motor switch protein FliM
MGSESEYASPRGATAELYDFRNPSKFTRDHGRILDQLLETFADQSATQLTSRLRIPTSQDLESLQQATYGAFIATLPEETVLLVASLSPIEVGGLLHIPRELAMLIVELQLGGPGDDEQPERGLTEIEAAMVDDTGQQLIGALKYSFEGVIAWNPSLASLVASPELAHAAAVGDQVLVATFKLEFREMVFRPSLVLPLAPILPFLDQALAAKRAARSSQEQARFKQALEGRVRKAPVDVSVRLRPTGGRLLDFMGINVGDVFQLSHPVNAPWEITSSGRVFAHGVPGSEGGRVAIRVVESGRE